MLIQPKHSCIYAKIDFGMFPNGGMLYDIIIQFYSTHKKQKIIMIQSRGALFGTA